MFSFDYTYYLAGLMLDLVSFEKTDIGDRFESYGLQTTDFTFFIISQIILFIIVLVAFVVVLSILKFVKLFDPKSRIW